MDDMITIVRRLDRLTRRLDEAEKELAKWRKGIIPSNVVTIGDGKATPEVRFLYPGSDADFYSVLRPDVDGVQRSFLLALDADETVALPIGGGAILWAEDITLDGGGVLTGTSYDVEDANGDPLALELKTILLVRRGLFLKPSATYGSIDSGCHFTLDATTGTTLTVDAAPIQAPFFIHSAYRRWTT